MILSNPTFFPHGILKEPTVNVLCEAKDANNKTLGELWLTEQSAKTILREFEHNGTALRVEIDVERIKNDPQAYLKSNNSDFFGHDWSSFNITVPTPEGLVGSPMDLMCEYFARKKTGQNYVSPNEEQFHGEIASHLKNFEAPYAEHHFSIKENDFKSWHQKVSDTIQETASKIQALLQKEDPQFSFTPKQCCPGDTTFELKRGEQKVTVLFQLAQPHFVIIDTAKRTEETAACSSSKAQS